MRPVRTHRRCPQAQEATKRMRLDGAAEPAQAATRQAAAAAAAQESAARAHAHARRSPHSRRARRRPRLARRRCGPGPRAHSCIPAWSMRWERVSRSIRRRSSVAASSSGTARSQHATSSRGQPRANGNARTVVAGRAARLVSAGPSCAISVSVSAAATGSEGEGSASSVGGGGPRPLAAADPPDDEPPRGRALPSARRTHAGASPLRNRVRRRRSARAPRFALPRDFAAQCAQCAPFCAQCAARARAVLCAQSAQTPVFALRKSHCEPRFRTAPAQCEGSHRTAPEQCDRRARAVRTDRGALGRNAIALRQSSAKFSRAVRSRWDGVLRWVGVWDLPT